MSVSTMSLQGIFYNPKATFFPWEHYKQRLDTSQGKKIWPYFSMKGPNRQMYYPTSSTQSLATDFQMRDLQYDLKPFFSQLILPSFSPIYKCKISLNFIMDLTVSAHILHVETLIPNMTIFGRGPLRRSCLMPL